MDMGFTGTRKGMTERQKAVFRDQLLALKPDIFRHGDCIGADADAHELVRKHCPKARIIIYPANSIGYRAFCKGDVARPMMNPLFRNKMIVEAAELLVAFPDTKKERLRSGTWATIRYARKIGKRVDIVYP
jgi:hypothetical protein